MKIASFHFNVGWIFFAIIAFCIYVLFGLYVTENLESFMQKILGWVIYTVLWATFLNVFILSYFWSVVKNKTGPPGLRGPEGETGDVGIEGTCSLTAAQAYCMQQLNYYIDELYKAKTNKSILNSETQKFPCKYLNEKIQKIAGSRQFQVIVGNLSNQNKVVINIINYLKSLWKDWFELLFNATSNPGIWFNDEFGDEHYNWSGTNPFDEIKKYDVYYWGITRDFRPLKAEICRSTMNHNSSKFPQPNLSKTEDSYDEPRLKVIETNYYKYGANDWKTEGGPDVSWWRPRTVLHNSERYYPVGDIIIESDRDDDNTFYWPADEDGRGPVKSGNLIIGDNQHPDPRDISLDNNNQYFQGYNYEDNDKHLSVTQDQFIRTGTGPDKTTVLVAGDVVSPLDVEILKDVDTGGRFWLNHYKLVCPEGYTSMGDITISNKLDRYHTALKQDQFKCVPTECVEPLVQPKPLSNGWNIFGGGWGNLIKRIREAMEAARSGNRAATSKWNWSEDYNILGLTNSETQANERASYKNGYNLFRVGPDLSAPFYKFKKSCLEKTPKLPIEPVTQFAPPPSTKDVEKENEDIGIGWYGHPYKLDPKYSIFTFMNMIPEGMIVHQGTGSRFYIVHVEGDDINLFNILVYNPKTSKYDGSLKAIDYNTGPAIPQTVIVDSELMGVNPNIYDPNEVEYTNKSTPAKRIEIRPLKKVDKRQQWKIILDKNDKKRFRLKNVIKNTYLYIGQEPREGVLEFSSVDIQNDNYNSNPDPAFQNLAPGELYNKTHFTFISTFGPQLNVIDDLEK